uniref:Uncharacterized protein n=1 Tax=Janibacter limosus TaxID=53458 RepID=A0AC61U324_9MICO|nr:hypothetical protein [Janibacter limosus]
MRPGAHDLKEMRVLGLSRGLIMAGLPGGIATASGIALTTTSGWLIVRADQRPQIMLLLTTIVAVRTFGLARPVFRYWERLRSHDVALGDLAERRTLNLRGPHPPHPSRARVPRARRRAHRRRRRPDRRRRGIGASHRPGDRRAPRRHHGRGPDRPRRPRRRPGRRRHARRHRRGRHHRRPPRVAVTVRGAHSPRRGRPCRPARCRPRRRAALHRGHGHRRRVVARRARHPPDHGHQTGPRPIALCRSGARDHRGRRPRIGHPRGRLRREHPRHGPARARPRRDRRSPRGPHRRHPCPCAGPSLPAASRRAARPGSRPWWRAPFETVASRPPQGT